MSQKISLMNLGRRHAMAGAVGQDRGAPDAVDPGYGVKQRPDDRREDDDADPADGGADLVLRHHRMRAGDGRRHDGDDRKDMRPIG